MIRGGVFFAVVKKLLYRSHVAKRAAPRAKRFRRGGSRVGMGMGMGGCGWMAVLLVLAVPLGCDQSGSEMDLFNLDNYTAAPYAEVLQASEISGRVNYRVIREGYTAPLDKYLELAAAQGPKSKRRIFFQPRHRASYYLNVYHALLLRTWLEHGAADDPAGLQLDPAWLDEKKHTVDGEVLSLNEIAEQARVQCGKLDLSKRERGETGARTSDTAQLIEFALNPGTLDGPPIPSPPFDAETFERVLNNHVRAYLAEPTAFRRTDDGFSAPEVLGRIRDRVPNMVTFVDTYVPATYPDKLALLRAVKEDRLTYRPRSFSLALPLDPTQAVETTDLAEQIKPAEPPESPESPVHSDQNAPAEPADPAESPTSAP